MTGSALLALVIASAFAVADWVAVRAARKRLEYVCKPATMVALVGAAILLEPADPTSRAWFVTALVLSMLGDVWLMLPQRPFGPADTFSLGLASFLLAHLAYIAGLTSRGLDAGVAVLGLALVAAGARAIAPRILAGVRAHEPRLLAPVVAYMSVISTMVVAASASGNGAALAGALLFYVSDTFIGWNRFVRTQRHGGLAVIVPYHVGQALLVASLAV